MQQWDKQIIAGFAIGVSTFLLSFIFAPLYIVGIIGLVFSSYCVGMRAQAAQEYRNTLENAVGCLEWALTDVSKRAKGSIVNCTKVTDLLDTLAPLMSKQQLKDVIDDSVENALIERAEGVVQEDHQELLDRPLNQKERAVYYGIYGYRKGEPKDVAEGLYVLASEGCNYVKNAVTGRLNRQPETPAAPKP